MVRLYGTWITEDIKPGDLLGYNEENSVYYRTWDLQYQDVTGKIIGPLGAVWKAIQDRIHENGVPVITFQVRVPYVGTSDPAKAFFTVPVTVTLDRELILQDNKLTPIDPFKRKQFLDWLSTNTVGIGLSWKF